MAPNRVTDLACERLGALTLSDRCAMLGYARAGAAKSTGEEAHLRMTKVLKRRPCHLWALRARGYVSEGRAHAQTLSSPTVAEASLGQARAQVAALPAEMQSLRSVAIWRQPVAAGVPVTTASGAAVPCAPP